MKYAVVIDDTSGMGYGIAKILFCKDYKVFATYVDPDFEEDIDNYEDHKIDLSKHEEVYRLIIYMKSQTGYLRLSGMKC